MFVAFFLHDYLGSIVCLSAIATYACIDASRTSTTHRTSWSFQNANAVLFIVGVIT